MKTTDFSLLQLFADAGSVVSTTTGYVNSATGAVTGFDAGNSVTKHNRTQNFAIIHDFNAF